MFDRPIMSNSFVSKDLTEEEIPSDNDPDLTEEEIWTVCSAFFESQGLAHHQLSSYDDFIRHGISTIIENNRVMVVEVRAVQEEKQFREKFLGKSKGSKKAEDAEWVKLLRKLVQSGFISDSFGGSLPADGENVIPEIKEFFLSRPYLYVKNWVLTKRYTVEFGELNHLEPSHGELNGECRRITPFECMKRDITYKSEIFIDIKTTDFRGHVNQHSQIHLGSVPVMVRSVLCNLCVSKGTIHNREKLALLKEDFYDPGGYFILKGAPKVIASQERTAHNQTYVFKNRKHKPKYVFYSEVRSCSVVGSHSTTSQVGVLKDNLISVTVPYIDSTAIPLGVMFRALGVSGDCREMVSYILPDFQDREALQILTYTLEYSLECLGTDDALLFIGKRGKKFNKPRKPQIETEDSEQVKNNAISYARHLLSIEFLPHLGVGNGSLVKKRFYLGYMVQKLLWVLLGRCTIQDRDHFANKRIATAGILLCQQFDNAFRRLRNEISSAIEKATQKGSSSIKVTSHISPKTITNALNGALSDNSWGVRGKNQGVSQKLDQYNLVDTLASLRKLVTPISSEGGKIEDPRKLHSSHWGIVCVTGDTRVVLADGTVDQIKFIEGKSVKTVHPKTLKDEPSRTNNFLTIKCKKLLKLESDTGKTIRCTPDHPFLISKCGNTRWVKAGDIKPGDLAVTTFVPSVLSQETQPTFIIDSGEISERRYRIELEKLGLVGKNLSTKQRFVLARLLGANCTDGHLGKTGGCFRCCFYLGEYEDALDVVDDIYSLGFSPGKISRKESQFRDDDNPEFVTTHRTWQVSKDGAFASLIAALGAPIGKKKFQILIEPRLVKMSTLEIQREWLSAIQGGDGSKLTYHFNQRKYRVALGKTQMTNEKEESIKFFELMKKVYSRLGVKASITYKRGIYFLEFEQSKENLAAYAKHISYVYCHQKSRLCAPVRVYLEHWNWKMVVKRNMYAEIRGGKGAEKYCQKYSLSPSQVYKIRSGSHNPRYHPNLPDFVKERAASNEKVLVSIASIENIPPETVYDFTTVSDNHSFIANGFVTHNCPAETPEGKKVGLVKQLALSARITVGARPESLLELLSLMRIVSFEQVSKSSGLLNLVKIFVNGDPIGVTRHPKETVESLRLLRRRGNLHSETSIAFDERQKEIRVSTEAGRLCRPLFVVAQGRVLLRHSHLEEISQGKWDDPSVWINLLTRGYIEYIDKAEEENLLVALSPRALNGMKVAKRLKFTHCEFHPSLMFSVGASTIPFPNYNQAPRNTYQAAMGKQASGAPSSNYRFLTRGKFNVMNYAQKPLVISRAAQMIGLNSLPRGQNAIVAVCPWQGFGQEDSIILNQDSIDRGFMCITTYLCFEAKVDKRRHHEQFEIPREEQCNRFKGNTEKLITETVVDEFHNSKTYCYAPVGAKVSQGDVLIGKTMAEDESSVHGKKKTDESVVFDHTWSGTVYSVIKDVDGNGYDYIRVVVAQQRKPTFGDKFCFSPDHEILTTRGWIPVEDVTKNHKVASLQEGELVYEKPIEIVSFESPEKMVEINSNQISFCVTPNHNMYVKRRHGKEFKLVKANSLFEKHVHYKKNAEWKSSGLESFVLPGAWYKNTKNNSTIYGDREISIEPWLTFFGIWIAEGWVREGREVGVATNKSRVRLALEQSLDLMRFEYKISKDGLKIHVYDKQLVIYMTQFAGGALLKFLPKWVWKLNQDQCRKLLGGMLLGDGHMNRKTPMYDTSSLQLKDDTMRLALHCGWAANARVRYPKGREKIIRGRNSITNAGAWRITIVKKQLEPAVNKHIKGQQKWVKSPGKKVYCCTVPSGLLYVRRVFQDKKVSQRPSWVGNSARHGGPLEVWP